MNTSVVYKLYKVICFLWKLLSVNSIIRTITGTVLTHAESVEEDTFPTNIEKGMKPNNSKSKNRQFKEQGIKTMDSVVKRTMLAHGDNIEKDTKPKNVKSKTRKPFSKKLSSEVFVEERCNLQSVKERLRSITHMKNAFSGNWLSYKEDALYLEKGDETETQVDKNSSAIPLRNYPKRSTEPSNLTGNSSRSAVRSFPNTKNTKIDAIKKDKPNKTLTRLVAMDCEMVGVDDGKDSILARVSLVNKYGDCIYDKFVKPREPVVDYRTHVSGVRPNDLKNGEDFETVQKEVAHILQGRILVGHGLSNDLKVLFLGHPRRFIRDTSRYKPFKKVSNGRTPGLKKLAAELLGVTIQEAEHDSVTDAKAAMHLYLMYRKEWELELHSRKKRKM